MFTNVIDVLNVSSGNDNFNSSHRVLDFSTESIFGGVYIRSDPVYDYFVFDGSKMDRQDEFEYKYEVLEQAVMKNPVSSKMALHLRFSKEHRFRLSSFYDELVMSYDENNCDNSVLTVVEEWSDLFQKIGKKVLSYEQEVGLFGELVILNKLLDSFGDDAIRYWKGPINGLHDFVNDGVWDLEIKTSVSPNPVVKIHPFEQLEPISNYFSLIIVKLKRKDSGLTLPELMEEIAVKVTQSQLNKFNDLIIASGYKFGNENKYKRRFDVINIERYEIDENKTVFSPINVKPGTLYHDVRWKFRTSDYDLEDCEDSYWDFLSNL